MQYENDMMFDDNVAVTVDRDSTNVLYVGANKSAGEPLLVEVIVNETFATTVSMAINLFDSADDSTFGGVAIAGYGAILLANLTKGAKFQFQVPPIHLAYLKLKYDISTTATAGKVTAAIIQATRFPTV